MTKFVRTSVPRQGGCCLAWLHECMRDFEEQGSDLSIDEQRERERDGIRPDEDEEEDDRLSRVLIASVCSFFD